MLRGMDVRDEFASRCACEGAVGGKATMPAKLALGLVDTIHA